MFIINENKLYATDNNTIKVFDIADPLNIAELSPINITANALSLAYSQSNLYIASSTGLLVYNTDTKK